MLSRRVEVLSTSLTIAIAAIAREMKLMGEEILSFSAGEPDFEPPQLIKDAVINAINEGGYGQYTPVPGITELLDAITIKFTNDNILTYDRCDIVTCVGAKHALFNLFQATINKDDEVIIPSPYWVTYPEIIKFCEGTPVFIETTEKNDFKITPEQLSNSITPKTKFLILNSPSNPTGSVYTKEELLALSEVLKETNIMVVSDEIYEKIIYEDKFVSTASISDDMFNRTITINGLSKCAAIPGWRFGYIATPNKEIISGIKKLQSQSTSNITSIIQYAAIPALLGQIDNDIEEMRKTFQERRDVAVELFQDIPNISVTIPKGSFYLFVNISKIEKDSIKFCKSLLENEKVALVPGIAFGVDGYVRFSFSTDINSIKQGIGRIRNFISTYPQD